jgi:citrate lyase subunit beta/citryl-CoA lyase
MNVQSICSASKRVIAIAYGSEDFITDLGGIHDKEHQSLFTARAMIAMGARAQNVAPIDTVHVRVKDLEDLEVNLELSVKLGFEGMLVLNPIELDLVHQYFSPTEEQVKHSQDILKYDDEARKEGKGVAIINGKFIGPPFVAKAKKILLKHELVNKNK